MSTDTVLDSFLGCLPGKWPEPATGFALFLDLGQLSNEDTKDHITPGNRHFLRASYALECKKKHAYQMHKAREHNAYTSYVQWTRYEYQTMCGCRHIPKWSTDGLLLLFYIVCPEVNLNCFACGNATNPYDRIPLPLLETPPDMHRKPISLACRLRSLFENLARIGIRVQKSELHVLKFSDLGIERTKYIT